MRRNLPEPFHERSFLAATLVDAPWRDPEIDSLVAEDDGEIVGFIAAQTRRLRFEDRSIRAVCCSHLVVDKQARTSAAGVLLLKRLLGGPQELTFSDTATDVVLRVWRALGGESDHTRSLDWMLVLHPARWAGSVALAVARRQPLWREFLPVMALPAQAAGPRLLARAFPETDPDVQSKDADASTVAAALPEVTRGLRLYADHDEAYLSHVFGWLWREGLVVRLVSRGERPIGWYAYVLREGRASRVLHLAALERDVDAVVGDMVNHASDSGSAVLVGRCEPHLADPLRQRAATLGFARLPLISTRAPGLRATLASRSSLLTQLDGEWFLT
jgi:hypothetical protein